MRWQWHSFALCGGYIKVWQGFSTSRCTFTLRLTQGSFSLQDLVTSKRHRKVKHSTGVERSAGRPLTKHTQCAISMHSDKHSHIHSTLKASAASTCQTHASMILTTFLDMQKAYEWTLVYSFLSYWASSRSHSVIYGRLILQHNQTGQSQLRNMLGLPWQTTENQQLKSKVQMKGLQFSCWTYSRSAF